MTTQANCRCEACSAARKGKPPDESGEQMKLFQNETNTPINEPGWVLSDPTSADMDSDLKPRHVAFTNPQGHPDDHPAARSSVALSVAAKEIPKMTLAGRLDFAMELVMGLPMERDDQGNVTKRGPPLITPEQALELLRL